MLIDLRAGGAERRAGDAVRAGIWRENVRYFRDLPPGLVRRLRGFLRRRVGSLVVLRARPDLAAPGPPRREIGGGVPEVPDSGAVRAGVSAAYFEIPSGSVLGVAAGSLRHRASGPPRRNSVRAGEVGGAGAEGGGDGGFDLAVDIDGDAGAVRGEGEGAGGHVAGVYVGVLRPCFPLFQACSPLCSYGVVSMCVCVCDIN